MNTEISCTSDNTVELTFIPTNEVEKSILNLLETQASKGAALMLFKRAEEITSYTLKLR